MPEAQPDVNAIAAEFISKRIDGLIESLKDIGKAISDKARIAFLTSFQGYIAKVWDRHSKARSFFYRQESVPLYSFYVPVGIRAGNTLIPRANAKEVFAVSRHIVIQGSGGAGKTVLSRHLLLDILVEREKLPAFVELREMNHSQRTVIELVLSSVKDAGLEMNEDMFKLAMKEGFFALIFDGFDELSPKFRKAVAAQIREIAVGSPQNWILVTSRPDNEFSSWSGFAGFAVQPLTLEQAVELVKKTPVEEDLILRFTQDLKTTLYKSHESFLSNPLLLSIMLITYHDSADIPNKLSVFYTQAYEALFQRHDAWKGGYKRPRACALDIHDFARVFSGFSILAYDRRMFSFPSSVALDILKKTRDLTKVTFDPEEFLSDSIQAVCLLVEDGLQLSYAHRSFQEYFAARFIAETTPKLKETLLNRVTAGARADSVLRLLHEMQPEFVEVYYLLPRLEQLLEKFKIGKSGISKSSFLAYLQYRFDGFRVGGEHAVIAMLGHRSDKDFDAEMFALGCCSSLTVTRFTTDRPRGLMEYIKRVVPEGKEIDIRTAKLNTDDEFFNILYSGGNGFTVDRLKKLKEIAEAIRRKCESREEAIETLFS